MKTIWDIRKQLGLKKYEHPKIVKYEGTFGTGDFEELFDYDAGILGVVISVTAVSISKDLYTPYIAVYTVDDGVWNGFTPNGMPLEECNALVEKVASAWPWKTKLPTEKEINEFLMPFGMWGEYTG